MTTPLQWVMATGAGKPVGEDRRIIRSHVMRGKNRRKKTTEAPARGRAGRTVPLPRTTASFGIGNADNAAKTKTASKNDANDERAIVLPPSPTHVGSGTGLECVGFADVVDANMIEHLFKYFTVSSEMIYPAAYCLDRDPLSSDWIAWLAKEPSYLHITVTASQVYGELAQFRKNGGGASACSGGSSSSSSSIVIRTPDPAPDLDLEGVFSPATWTSFTRTLMFLQKTIQARDNPPTDGVLLTVASFVIISSLARNPNNAKKHMLGLMSLVKLRGGVQALGWDMRRKVARADIGLCLATGDKPMLELAGTEWMTVCLGEGLIDKGQEILPLSDLWKELKAICRLINDAVPTGRKVNLRLFNDSLISTHLRLIALGQLAQGTSHDRCGPRRDDCPPGLAPWFDPSSPLHDSLRIAMLCFASSVWLDIPGTIAFMSRLTHDTRGALDFVLRSTLVDDDAKLWMLLLASVTTLRDDGCAVEEVKRLSGGRSWASVIQMFERDWLWVDGIHTRPARAIFESADNLKVVILEE